VQHFRHRDATAGAERQKNRTAKRNFPALREAGLVKKT
jgi:hypothetical protein